MKCNAPIMKALLVSVLALISNSAFADAASTVQVITGLYDGFMTPIKDFGAAVAPHGISLVGALLIIHVVVGAVGHAAGSRDLFQLFIDGLKLSFVGSLLLAMLMPATWLSQMVGGSYSGTGVQIIEQGLRNLLAYAGLPGDSRQALSMITTGIFESIFKLTEIKVMPDGMSWYEVILNIIPLLLSLVWVLLSIVAMLIAGALVLGEALASDLMLTLSVAFAPLLIPWLLFRPLSFLFGGWLRAILIAGVGLVIAGLFVKGMQAFSSAAVKALAAVPKDSLFVSWVTAFTHFSPLFIGSIILILLANKVTNMASAIISGGGLDGFSMMAMRQAVAGMGSAGGAPGTAARQIAGGAANTARAVASGASAGVNAARGMAHARSTKTASPMEGARAGMKAAADRKAASASNSSARVDVMSKQLNGRMPTINMPKFSGPKGATSKL